MSYHANIKKEKKGKGKKIYTLVDLPDDACYEITTHFWEWKQFVIFSWVCKSTYLFVKNYKSIDRNAMVLIRSTEKERKNETWYDGFLNWWYKNNSATDITNRPNYRDHYQQFFTIPPFQSVKAVYWKYNNLKSFPIYLHLKELRLKNVTIKNGLVLYDLSNLEVVYLVNIQTQIILQDLVLQKLVLKGCPLGQLLDVKSNELVVDRISSKCSFVDVMCNELIKYVVAGIYSNTMIYRHVQSVRSGNFFEGIMVSGFACKYLIGYKDPYNYVLNSMNQPPYPKLPTYGDNWSNKDFLKVTSDYQ